METLEAPKASSCDSQLFLIELVGADKQKGITKLS